MLNDPRTHGLWEITAPPPPATVPLAGDTNADVVIVGAGYTGLSAALHLAEAGVSVIVLEAVEIGFGGAGRNVGLVNAGLWVMPDDIAKELPTPYGDRVIDLLGAGPRAVYDLVNRLGIACEAVPNGTLHCAVGPSGVEELAERARQWQKRGAPVHLLEGADAAAKVGSAAYPAVLLDQRAGTIQPLAYVRGLAHAATAAGVRIHTSSPVIGLDRDGTRWRVTTAAGSVTATWVVPAGDVFAQGPFAASRTEQVRLPYFNFATAPLSDNVARSILPERQGAWDTREVLSSFRFDAANRLVFGSVGALRGTGTTIHRAWAMRAMRKIYPQIGDVPFESEWYGWIGMTDNAMPRFHRFAEHVIGFSGYNGRGISPGTQFGRVTADFILGRLTEAELPLPVTEARAVPWRPVKEAYYEAGSQIAHLVDARL